SSIHRRRGIRTGIEVTCCNSFLARIFEELFGKGAENKRIPDFLFNDRIEEKSPSVLPINQYSEEVGW
ncbi:MAG: hypothetical protein V2A62_05370, partial [Candidatus Woesearchaeota archaeon]